MGKLVRRHSPFLMAPAPWKMWSRELTSTKVAKLSGCGPGCTAFARSRRSLVRCWSKANLHFWKASTSFRCLRVKSTTEERSILMMLSGRTTHWNPKPCLAHWLTPPSWGRSVLWSKSEPWSSCWHWQKRASHVQTSRCQSLPWSKGQVGQWQVQSYSLHLKVWHRIGVAFWPCPLVVWHCGRNLGQGLGWTGALHLPWKMPPSWTSSSSMPISCATQSWRGKGRTFGLQLAATPCQSLSFMQAHGLKALPWAWRRSLCPCCQFSEPKKAMQGSWLILSTACFFFGNWERTSSTGWK